MHSAPAFTLTMKNGKRTFASPIVMGIINASPESFFNPHHSANDALITADRMISEGATILDVGGEATNPAVNLEDSPDWQSELNRVLPVVRAIKERFDVLVSVDTSQPNVMRAVIDAGADIINDQRALAVGDALTIVSEAEVAVCLMHFFDAPRLPGSSVKEVLLHQIKRDLQQTIARCEIAGISRGSLIIDPGFGQGNYGKNAAENYYLLSQLVTFHELQLPILSGWSRKSMLGDLLEAPPENRLYAGIAADTIAAYHGAKIIRTHDVKAASDAIQVAIAVQHA